MRSLLASGVSVLCLLMMSQAVLRPKRKRSLKKRRGRLKGKVLTRRLLPTNQHSLRWETLKRYDAKRALDFNPYERIASPNKKVGRERQQESTTVTETVVANGISTCVETGLASDEDLRNGEEKAMAENKLKKGDEVGIVDIEAEEGERDAIANQTLVQGEVILTNKEVDGLNIIGIVAHNYESPREETKSQVGDSSKGEKLKEGSLEMGKDKK